MKKIEVSLKDLKELKLSEKKLRKLLEHNRYSNSQEEVLKVVWAEKLPQSAFGFNITVAVRDGMFILRAYNPFMASGRSELSVGKKVDIEYLKVIDKEKNLTLQEKHERWYLISDHSEKIQQDINRFEHEIMDSIILRINKRLKKNKLENKLQGYLYRRLKKYPEFYRVLNQRVKLASIFDRAFLEELNISHNTPSRDSLLYTLFELGKAPQNYVNKFCDEVPKSFLNKIRHKAPEFYEFVVHVKKRNGR
jgi:hypothetical protein